MTPLLRLLVLGAAIIAVSTAVASDTTSNGTVASATDLGNLGDTTITDSVGGFVAFPGKPDGVDFFVFEANYDGEMRVRLTYDLPRVIVLVSSPRATIVDETGAEIPNVHENLKRLTNVDTGDKTDIRTLTWHGNSSTPYYVRVTSGTNRGALSFDYTLRVTAPSADDAFEPNNTQTTASELGVLSSRNYMPDLKMNTSADNDYFQFRSCIPGKARIDLSYRKPLALDPVELVLRVLDKNGNEIATTPNRVITTPFTAVISESLSVQQETDYFLEVSMARFSRAVKSYAMTISVPVVMSPEVVATVEGGEGKITYTDQWNVFDLERSSSLVTWQNQSVTRDGYEEQASFALPGERYFRVKQNCAGRGGVLLPWPDFGIIIATPIPFPDPSDIVFPGEILSDPRWKDFIREFNPRLPLP